jgi:hypothetical protein
VSIVIKLRSIGGLEKADLQPTDGADPNHVAVNETVTQLNSKQYWYTLLSIQTRVACSTQPNLTTHTSERVTKQRANRNESDSQAFSRSFLYFPDSTTVI